MDQLSQAINKLSLNNIMCSPEKFLRVRDHNQEFIKTPNFITPKVGSLNKQSVSTNEDICFQKSMTEKDIINMDALLLDNQDTNFIISRNTISDHTSHEYDHVFSRQ